MHEATPGRNGSTNHPGTDPDDDVMAFTASRLETFRRYTYWSMVGAVVVLLVLPALIGPVPRPPDPLGTLSLLAVVVLIAALIPLIDHHIPRSPDRRPLSARQRIVLAAVGGIASVVAAGIWLRAGDELLWALPPAMVASLVIASFPRNRRRIVIVVVMVVAVTVGVAVDIFRGPEAEGSALVAGMLATAFALFLTLTSIWTWNIAVELDRARRQAASLAVANERLRFAADLHDIQGHHLQVIALKSELAARVVHDDAHTAAREIGEVQQLALDALRDTRAVVQGYRRTTLDAEIANATTVLSSAGIDAQLHVDPDSGVDELPASTRHLLGLVVREAITNLLRHSTATQADIALTRDDDIHLTVINDGATDEPTTTDGGLHALSQRLDAADGALTWRRTGSHFEVRATLPQAPHAAPPDTTSSAAHPLPSATGRTTDGPDASEGGGR